MCLKVNQIDMLNEIDIHPGSDSRKLDTAHLINEVKKYCKL